MPFSSSDAATYTSKARTAASRKKWAEVANAVYDECMADGDDETCAALAIKTANAKVAEQETTRGLYMTEPHGRLIADGKKSAVLQGRRIGLESGPVVVVSGHYAYGEALFDAPAILEFDEVDHLFSWHRVTAAERKRWWPKKRVLFVYKLVWWRPYQEKLEVKLPDKIRTYIDRVEFVEAGDAGGVWRTVNGLKIFIKDGEDPKAAFDRALSKVKKGGGKGFGDAVSTPGALTTSPDQEHVLGAGATRPKLTDIKDDGQGIWKPRVSEHLAGHSGDSEVGAYLISELVGAGVPQTAYAKLDGVTGTVQQKVECEGEGYDLGPKEFMSLIRSNEEQVSAIVALDLIIGNTDRHQGNWLYTKDGKIIPVDHGNAKWKSIRDDYDRLSIFYMNSLGNPNFQDTGRFKISPSVMTKLKGLKYREFRKAVGRGRSNVPDEKLDVAWDNLQYIIEQDGEIEWS